MTCTLATASSGVTLLNATSSFGDCRPGEINHSARYTLMLEVATNAPTGVQFPFSLSLQDADGNSSLLAFNLSCVPQLGYLSVSPRTNSAGGIVAFTAYFYRNGYVPDDNGMANVRVLIQDPDETQTYPLDLVHVTGSTGVFSGAWTIPSVSDWKTSVRAGDQFGKTGTYNNIISGGFSTKPYDPQCDVLLYNDYQVIQHPSPPFSHVTIIEAIRDAGASCFYWDGYYRGMISDSELSWRPILFYMPFSGGSDLPYDTQDRRALIRHLGNGGQVALLGSRIAYSIYNSGDTTSRYLLGNAFGCTWVTNFGGYYSKKGFTKVTGQAGDPIGAGLIFSADVDHDGEDEIQAVGSGVPCFCYDTNSAVEGARPEALGTSGVRTSNTVFLAWFGSYNISPSSVLYDLVRNILSYFNVGGPYVHGGTPADESNVMIGRRTLAFHWGGFNTRDLDHYEVAIGTLSNGCDALDWTPVSAAINSYSWDSVMRRGQSYFCLVRSVTTSGVVGQGPVCSGGIHAGLTIHTVADDYDGDRKSDPALVQSAGGNWGVAMSAGNYAVLLMAGFGSPNWLALPGDFDADGKADPAIYNINSGDWQVKGSATGYTVQSLSGLGGAGFIPMAGDYDADGKADPGVYQVTSGVWTVRLSASGYAPVNISGFGGPEYIPVMGDFDGDGKADPALYQPDTGLWVFQLSVLNYGIVSVSGFGGPGTVPLTGDFDGDRKADLAIYQPASGYWSAKLSTCNYAIACLAGFRCADAEPLAADFDGDGNADLALYSPSSGLWGFQLSSRNYDLVTLAVGAADYLPVQ